MFRLCCEPLPFGFCPPGWLPPADAPTRPSREAGVGGRPGSHGGVGGVTYFGSVGRTLHTAGIPPSGSALFGTDGGLPSFSTTWNPCETVSRTAAVVLS